MIIERKKPARVWSVLRAYGKAMLTYPGLFSAAVVAVITIVTGEIVSPLYLKQFVNVLAGGTAAPGIFNDIWR